MVDPFSKERFSSELLDEAINWTSIAVRVPPNRMPRLGTVLAGVDADALRRAAASLRRRLLWTSIYGNCELGDHGTCPERGACQPPPHGCAPVLTARSDSLLGYVHSSHSQKAANSTRSTRSCRCCAYRASTFSSQMPIVRRGLRSCTGPSEGGCAPSRGVHAVLRMGAYCELPP